MSGIIFTMKAISAKNLESIEKYKFIYHFLPHPYHRQRAGLLSHGAFLTYTFILTAFLIIFRLLPSYFPGVLGYASNINISDLLQYTNERRVSAGLEPVSLNSKLTSAAYKKANDMINAGYWSHISPKGVQPWDFILAEDYDYIYAGENLAKNFSNSRDVVQAWYDSSTHRENLLNPHYNEVGFAVLNGVLNGYETTVVVQMFGKTRAPQQIATVKVEEPVRPAIAEAEEVQVAQDVKDISVDLDIVSTPLIDVRNVSQSMAVVFGGFLTSLLGLDIWYSKRRGILKLTGSTVAHLIFLIGAVFSVLVSILPGAVL